MAKKDFNEIQKLYVDQKLTLKEVSKRTGTPYRRLRRLLMVKGIKIRGDRGLRPNEFTITKKRLEDLYIKQRLSTTDMAKILGINQSTVWNKLYNAGIPIRSISEGEHNAIAQGKQWGKPGRRKQNVRASGGYLMCIVPEHPRANHQGYVAIHVLVWEAEYGSMPIGSVIHHINGDVTDNRVENLHLFTSSEHSKFHAFARHQAWAGSHIKEARLACPIHLLAGYLEDWLAM